MTDIETIPTDTTETKVASKAVQVLCAQHLQRVAQESEALAAIALESDGLDPKDGWKLDISKAQYVKTV